MRKIASDGSKDGSFIDSKKDSTVLAADWLNMIQDELVAVATMDGRTLDDGDNKQISSAIASLLTTVETNIRSLASTAQTKVNANETQLNNQVGEIVTTLSNTPPPDCLPCRGEKYKKSDFPKLIEYVNRYNLWSRDHSDYYINRYWGKFIHSYYQPTHSDFHVPKLTGLFLRMAGDGAGALGIYQGDEIKEHRHLTYWGEAAKILDSAQILHDGSKHLGASEYDYDNARPYTSTVGGDETRPRNVAVNFWVRYQ